MSLPTSRVVASAAALALVLALAACGGEDKAAAEKPAEATTSATPSSSSAPSTPTPTPSPTLRPLSRFEDRVQVKVLRKFAAAAAVSTTKDEKQMPRIAPFVTSSGLVTFRGLFAADMGKEYPGPVPFTPVGVRLQGGRAEVPACVWTYGFTVDPKTNRPTEARKIEAGTFELVRSAGTWKVDTLRYAQFDCSKVVVRGPKF